MELSISNSQGVMVHLSRDFFQCGVKNQIKGQMSSLVTRARSCRGEMLMISNVALDGLEGGYLRFFTVNFG